MGISHQLTTSTYSELRFAEEHQDSIGHEIYWQWNEVAGEPCRDCKMTFVVRDSLMQVVQAINPGIKPIPEWVSKGAIIGVQGGTDKMLATLEQVTGNKFSPNLS